MIPPELMKILACPDCKSGLQELPDLAVLRCVQCNLDYPVEDGTPVLLLDRARPVGDSSDIDPANGP